MSTLTVLKTPSEVATSDSYSTTLDLRTVAPSEFYAWATSHGISHEAARRWAGAALGRGVRDANSLVSMSHIPKKLGHHVMDLPSLTLKNHVRSALDGFEKLLFGTRDGLSIETVLIPLKKDGAVSLCISSQVGCVMGCVFCATARMPQRRNLSSWEILDQVAQARGIVHAQGRRVTGAVFMGMGEPFLNFKNVIIAADWLRHPIENAISGKAITISTVGLVQEIERFTDLHLPFRLSISLGAATDEKRAKLVPVAARTPVATVMAAARRHALTRKQRINLAYVCISGENVGEDDAKALAALIGDTPARLDLIDVTDPTQTYKPPCDEELKLFRDALARHLRQPVARRYSGGSDIQASCGSLAGQI